jgi:cytochrome c peroxidase
LFEGRAGCARCHVPPLFTEPGHNLHAPAEIGIDSFQAERSPTGKYRTTPLRGLWSRSRGGYYHDGRFVSLEAVVDHYDVFFGLELSESERADLIEYLLSL